MPIVCNLRRVIKASRLLLSCLLLGACALSPPKPTPVPAPPVDTASPTKPAPTAEAQQQFSAAMTMLNAGQTEQAKQQLQQLATAYPDLAIPLLNLGLIELKANRFDNAAKYFQQAVQRDSELAAAHNYLGVCYRNLGKFEAAEAAYQAAIKADPNYAAAHLNLGVLYDLYLQKPQQALEEYENYQTLQSTPDDKVASWIKEVGRRAKSQTKQEASS